MLYLIPAILSPTIILALYLAMRKDTEQAMALNVRMLMLQRQFFQNHPH